MIPLIKLFKTNGAGFWLVLALLAAVPARAQRHIKGQLALTPVVGILDRVPTSLGKANGQGLAAGLDLTRYTHKETYWKVSYLYDQKYYANFGRFLTSSRHQLSFDWAPLTLHDHRRHVYIAPIIGASVGYELVNNNEETLPEGTIRNAPSVTGGIQAGIEGEYYVAERIALVATFQTRYLPPSDVSVFRSYGLIGIRFSFFRN